ncbi:MAG TPA: AMP-binding protein [Synechococcales cyanobacterium M55_K2018_004]|nr:AMP-binding protein [Synechococcales cyanobacterium M55_K2018_004]
MTAVLDRSVQTSSPLSEVKSPPFIPGEQSGLKPFLDHRDAQSVPEVFRRCASHPSIKNRVALQDPHAKPEVSLTYEVLFQQIQQFAVGLQQLAVKPGDRISLISDNSPRWLIADLGILTAGAVDVVRSSAADPEELAFILANSGSTGLVVENLATLKKLQHALHALPIRFAVVLAQAEAEMVGREPMEAMQVLSFAALMALAEGKPLEPVDLTPDSLATLLYTSGTTGKPKGVMLTHGNLLHQINGLYQFAQLQPGDRVLTILPTWHAYERTCEYFLLSQGCTMTYTNLRHVKQDLKQYQPNFMVGVPRLWESIYEGIQKQFREQPANKQALVNFFLDNSRRYIEAKRVVEGLSLTNPFPTVAQKAAARAEMALRWPAHRLAHKLVYTKVKEATGGQIKQVISGGGSLAMHLDTFFEMIGLEVLVGYGLTETSPVLTARSSTANMRGSAGQPMPNTEIRIVDPDSRKVLPKGERGLVLARGPQVMRGYYENPEATAKAIDPEGWFDTGDLGMIVGDRHLVLTGRAKDTIVLTNGENIEPQPIEDACLRSAFIDQIMLVGQDQRSLGALIVPNLEALGQWAIAQGVLSQLDPLEGETLAHLLAHEKVLALFRQELTREVKDRPGFRPDDRIGPFRLLTEPFTIENGLLTQTLKIRRLVVMERYRSMIEDMFA